jgi:hypothetical protein
MAMDKEYLKQHLISYMKVITPKQYKESVFAKKTEDDRFMFGYVKSNGDKVYSIVTKQIAITLAIGIFRYLEYEVAKEGKKQKRKRLNENIKKSTKRSRKN